jgi:hypothetical protein
MILAAARRFVLLLGAIGGASVLIGLALGLLLGASANRSVSLALYVSGSFLLVGGFLLGSRGPLRRDDAGGGGFSVRRTLRRATPDEMRESVNLTTVLVLLGFVLLMLGAAIDERYQLV